MHANFTRLKEFFTAVSLHAGLMKYANDRSTLMNDLLHFVIKLISFTFVIETFIMIIVPTNQLQPNGWDDHVLN